MRIIILLSVISAAAFGEQPTKANVCEVQANPAAYHHKLIEVTALVKHGFEDFTFSDDACPQAAIWLEYGGTRASGTMYCCPGGSRRRSDSLTLDGIRVPLVEDPRFRAFDRSIQRPGDKQFRATLVGRFFRQGYGHFGTYSLLAIQQVLYSSRSATIGSNLDARRAGK